MRKLVLYAMLICLLGGCKEDKPEGVVAYVGDAILTEQMISSVLGDQTDAEQKLLYVQRWVDRELLYRAACDVGLDTDPELVRRLREIERDLLSAQYLQQCIGEMERIMVSDAEVDSVFQEHTDDYVRRERAVRFAEIVVSTVSDGWAVRKILKPHNFERVAAQRSLKAIDPFDEIGFCRESELDTELSKFLFSLREGGISSPRRLNDTVKVLMVIEKGAVGSPSTFEEVRNEIIDRITAEKYRARVSEIREELRGRTDYMFNREYLVELRDEKCTLPQSEAK